MRLVGIVVDTYLKTAEPVGIIENIVTSN